jgi:phosphohistidine swiveling domain-containing protein
MKLIKVLTRRYSLLEHELITQSLLKKNSSIPEVYYSEAVEVSRKGLLDIYTYQEDVDRIRKWIVDSANKDPKFVEIMLKKGLQETEKFSKLPFEIIENFEKMDDKEKIVQLVNLKKMLFDYSGYFDFDLHLGECNLKIEDSLVNELAKFHEYRKKAIIDFFDFLRKYSSMIAKSKGLEHEDFDFICFDEIVQFLKNELSVEEINKKYDSRSFRYIAITNDNDRKIFVGNDFDIQIEKIMGQFNEGLKLEEIKGASINRGVVQGEVKIINQLMKLDEIPSGKVIVTEMTHPDVTLALKKALAIVTDEGGITCHAANIAREFGIIAITGTRNATKILKDGDLVEVDANKGIVKIIKKAK